MAPRGGRGAAAAAAAASPPPVSPDWDPNATWPRRHARSPPAAASPPQPPPQPPPQDSEIHLEASVRRHEKEVAALLWTRVARPGLSSLSLEGDGGAGAVLGRWLARGGVARCSVYLACCETCKKKSEKHRKEKEKEKEQKGPGLGPSPVLGPGSRQESTDLRYGLLLSDTSSDEEGPTSAGPVAKAAWRELVAAYPDSNNINNSFSHHNNKAKRAGERAARAAGALAWVVENYPSYPLEDGASEMERRCLFAVVKCLHQQPLPADVRQLAACALALMPLPDLVALMCVDVKAGLLKGSLEDFECREPDAFEAWRLREVLKTNKTRAQAYSLLTAQLGSIGKSLSGGGKARLRALQSIARLLIDTLPLYPPPLKQARELNSAGDGGRVRSSSCNSRATGAFTPRRRCVPFAHVPGCTCVSERDIKELNAALDEKFEEINSSSEVKDDSNCDEAQESHLYSVKNWAMTLRSGEMLLTSSGKAYGDDNGVVKSKDGVAEGLVDIAGDTNKHSIDTLSSISGKEQGHSEAGMKVENGHDAATANTRMKDNDIGEVQASLAAAGDMSSSRPSNATEGLEKERGRHRRAASYVELLTSRRLQGDPPASFSPVLSRALTSRRESAPEDINNTMADRGTPEGSGVDLQPGGDREAPAPGKTYEAFLLAKKSGGCSRRGSLSSRRLMRRDTKETRWSYDGSVMSTNNHAKHGEEGGSNNNVKEPAIEPVIKAFTVAEAEVGMMH
eukprot:jgi/Chlat1/1477/Chrsp12S00107